jgi:hypothetical protein
MSPHAAEALLLVGRIGRFVTETTITMVHAYNLKVVVDKRARFQNAGMNDKTIGRAIFVVAAISIAVVIALAVGLV